MKLKSSQLRPVARPALRHSLLYPALAAAALWSPAASRAVDFGPFSLNGFAKVELTHNSNNCPDCQRFPEENKQRHWADELVPGAEYKDRGLRTTLLQPYLGVKFDIGGGFRLQGLISQRWRDGKEDIPGFLYEKNIALSHDDYGSVRIGTTTTRTWSVADYPYGSNVGLSDVWGSAGAGYGLLTKAIRVTTRALDVLEGDLVLEVTYDMGDTDFKINKPQFWEFYAQFHRGDLVIDATYQDTRNGTPSAWTHGPFTGLTPFPEDDAKLGGSGQSVALAMARYQLTPQWEISGGIKHSRWSGAYATITKVQNGVSQWNSMFNVDWTKDLGGGIYRGYEANSTDMLLGLRYRMGQWVAATGMTYLGKANTDNPTEAGQSNSVTWNTAQLTYEFTGDLRGLQIYGMGGYIRYGLDAVSKGCNGQPNRVPGTCSLSPMSMPGNAAFTNVDSRVARSGNYVGIGVVYAF